MKYTLLGLFIGLTLISRAQVDIDRSINLSGSGTNAKVSGIDTVIALKDAVNVKALQRGSLLFAPSTGTNTYAVTLSPAPTAYTAGMIVNFTVANTNTAACSLNVNGIGNRAIKKGVTTDLIAGDLVAGQAVSAIYDGANFQLLSPPSTLQNGSNNYIQNQTASNQTAAFRISGNGLFDGGNVGIGAGVTSPASKLHVYDAADSRITVSRAGALGTQSVWRYNSGTAEFGNLGGDNLSLLVAGVSRIFMSTAAGNYTGINTTLPAERLDVSDGALFLSGSTANKHGVLMDRGSAVATTATQGSIFPEWNGIDGNAEALSLRSDNIKFQNYDGTTEMVLRNGNVGIGNGATAPGAKFDVLGDARFGNPSGQRYAYISTLGVYTGVFTDNNFIDIMDLRNYDGTAANRGVGIRFSSGDNTNSYVSGRIASATEGAWSATASTQDAYMAFQTTLDGNLNERMRITSNGSVGIGTAPNASAALDVSSPNKGFLMPRMSTATRTSITGVAGLQVYDNTTNSIWYHDGTNWQATGVPAGTVSAFAGASSPAGYLLCNGAAVSRTTYAALFAVIGTIYGAGDGSTTFNLPDYRGYFLRGRDGGAGNDPDRAARTNSGGGSTGDNVGTKQADENKSHSHTFNRVPGGTGGGSGTALVYDNIYNAAAISSQSWNASGGNESRPKNIYVNYIIKY